MIRPLARVVVGGALLAVWLSVFVDHGTASVEVPTFLIGAIGVSAILFLAFGLFRGPNLTRNPSGSDFSWGSRVAGISLGIVAFAIARANANRPMSDGQIGAAAVLVTMAVLGVVLSYRIHQAAVARSLLLNRGVSIDHILIGRGYGLAAFPFVSPTAVELIDQIVVLYRCRLRGPTEFARVPSSSVNFSRYDDKRRITGTIDAGISEGGAEVRAVPMWDWEVFAAERDAKVTPSDFRAIREN